jgi:uncharacterized protein (DUF2252 family)
MTAIKASTRAYEHWLEAQIGVDFVKHDLHEKHEKMQDKPFSFLRATYWRWAEIILDVCPKLRDAPEVLAVGDIHLENFGTWRDADGRLIWGVNDFDDAAVMPYPLDLVRLATSALLARGKDGPSAQDVSECILDSYTAGLQHPSPFVLEREHKWLRKEVLLPECERAKFWSKFKEPDSPHVPERYRNALVAAMPKPHGAVTVTPRTAGTGSLGRPRFVARTDWNGGPILREAKAAVMSAWCLHHAPDDMAIRINEIAAGPFRAPDHRFKESHGILIRRLSANSRKIEVEGSADQLLSARMLEAMGREIANCHAGDTQRAAAIQADLKRRHRTWLRDSAKAAARAVAVEQAEYA